MEQEADAVCRGGKTSHHIVTMDIIDNALVVCQISVKELLQAADSQVCCGLCDGVALLCTVQYDGKCLAVCALYKAKCLGHLRHQLICIHINYNTVDSLKLQSRAVEVHHLCQRIACKCGIR